jgi:hypothetical protein
MLCNEACRAAVARKAQRRLQRPLRSSNETSVARCFYFQRNGSINDVTCYVRPDIDLEKIAAFEGSYRRC